MTALFEGNKAFYLADRASLVIDDREVAGAWYSPHVHHNPAYRYVVGKFVEADKANNNRQRFTLPGLQMAKPTITHAPMNINHQARRIVGAYTATDLIYPTQAAAVDAYGRRMPAPAGTPAMDSCPACGQDLEPGLDTCPHCGSPLPMSAQVAAAVSNPHIEALGVFWKHYFPEEYQLVEEAHAEGHLFFSMECVPERIQCSGDGGCGAEFAYAGRQSSSYCEHLNETASDKLLVNPHFTAGAILLPPIKPGWSNAEVYDLVSSYGSRAEAAYEQQPRSVEAREWESLMNQVLAFAARRDA